ncbi:head decoration protein [Caudoviricetes sp.]|nr:head decoration protein [Caudoviricetes sp.]UOF82203.1 head decoration protein [Caudoviricetes sp.]
MPNGISASEFRVIEAKTASYALTAQDHGKLFTTRGASGAITFTLPPVTGPALPSGWNCEFYNAAGQNMVIASLGSADNITTFNDLTADSITFSTASELIGASVKVTWDGTGWLAQLFTEETQTTTVA